MLGDVRQNDVLDLLFTTRNAGVPATLGGTPAVSVYKNNSLTQSTSGVTLDVDWDGVTGLNHLRVDTSSDGTFYATGSDFALVITTGTVGGISVVGVQIDAFSIAHRSALMPTTAGRMLDVTAANKVNGVVLVDTLTTYTGDTPQSGDAYARIGTAGAGLTALGDARVANLDATISSRTKPADTQARVTLVDTVTTYTGNTPQTGDNFARIGVAGAGLTALGDARLANLDAAISSLFTTAMTESYNADGAAATPAQALYVIMQRLTEFAIVGTTLTAKKLNGSTTAFTLTFDDATAPTSSTRAT